MKEQTRSTISENVERIDMYIKMISDELKDPDLVDHAAIIDHLEHMGECTDNIMREAWGG